MKIKKIIFLKKEKKMNLHYDYIFICSTPIFLLNSSNSNLLQKLTNNKKYFVSCIIELKKRIANKVYRNYLHF